MKVSQDKYQREDVDRLLAQSMGQLHRQIDRTKKEEQDFAVLIAKEGNKKNSSLKQPPMPSQALPSREWLAVLREIFIYHEKMLLHWGSLTALVVLALSVAIFDIENLYKNARFQQLVKVPSKTEKNAQAKPNLLSQKEQDKNNVTGQGQQKSKQNPQNTNKRLSANNKLVATRQVPSASDGGHVIDSKEEELLLAIELAENPKDRLLALRNLKKYYKKTANTKKLIEINKRIRKEKP